MDPEERLRPVAAAYNMDPHWLCVVITDLFGTNDFSGMRVLDIGAGQGLYSCALSSLGAQDIVAIEPESDGSRSGVIQVFECNIRQLRLNNVQHFGVTIQDFSAELASFDLILMYSVINHLDETHVQRLHFSSQSFNRYIELLKPILQLLKPGGELVIQDAARHHALTPLIKSGIIKHHPLYKSIEWEKHQNPCLWKNLLRTVGFREIRHHWCACTRYDWIRAILGGNPVVAWLIAPHFIIRAIC